MGDYFYSKGKVIKMGDTPSLAFFLHGNPDDPTQPGWGGRYIGAWERPHKVYKRVTTEQDSIEQFGVLELRLAFDKRLTGNPTAEMEIDRSMKAQIQNDTVRFLFSPKNPSKYNYTIKSNINSLNMLSGCIKAYMPPASNRFSPSAHFPNWWTDDPSPELMEEGQIGIKTINCWREEFLTDFARRMKRCKTFSKSIQ